jgi:hypothetical protein
MKSRIESSSDSLARPTLSTWAAESVGSTIRSHTQTQNWSPLAPAQGVLHQPLQ